MYLLTLIIYSGVSVWSAVYDRFNRNSIAHVLQPLWSLAAIDTGGSSKAAAILHTRYLVSLTRYCYFPSLMLYIPHLRLLEQAEPQCLENNRV